MLNENEAKKIMYDNLLYQNELKAGKELERKIESIIIESIFMTEYDKSLKHPDLYPDPAKSVEEELDRILLL